METFIYITGKVTPASHRISDICSHVTGLYGNTFWYPKLPSVSRQTVSPADLNVSLYGFGRNRWLSGTRDHKSCFTFFYRRVWNFLFPLVPFTLITLHQSRWFINWVPDRILLGCSQCETLLVFYPQLRPSDSTFQAILLKLFHLVRPVTCPYITGIRINRYRPRYHKRVLK